MGKAYEEMTLEELVAEQSRLDEAIGVLKEQRRNLIPFLDAAWEAKTAEEAAKADPRLTQGIG